MFIQQDSPSEDSTVLLFALKTIPLFLIPWDPFENGNGFTALELLSDLRATIVCAAGGGERREKRNNVTVNRLELECFFPEGQYSQKIRHTYVGV